MDFPRRAAVNEEIFRGINERIAEGAAQHRVEARLPFHCECDRASCIDTIEIRPAVYNRVLQQRYRFVVIAGHEDPAVERVVESGSEFLIVEKCGEAREQIDREHPQQHHRQR